MKAITMTDIEREHTLQVQELTQRIGDLCQQVNAITKQRDALLNACRAFMAAETFWEGAERYAVMESVIERMKDVDSVEGGE